MDTRNIRPGDHIIYVDPRWETRETVTVAGINPWCGDHNGPALSIWKPDGSRTPAIAPECFEPAS